MSQSNKKSLLQTASQIYKEYLLRKSMFFTKERLIILESVLEQKEHFSADELLFELQKTGRKVSRATVYRSLSQMVDCQILAEADFGHGHSHYEIALGEKRHAHLICRESGVVEEVHSDELNRLLQKIADSRGFELRDYTVQLFGIKRKK